VHTGLFLPHLLLYSASQAGRVIIIIIPIIIIIVIIVIIIIIDIIVIHLTDPAVSPLYQQSITLLSGAQWLLSACILNS